jgi:uncharacterized protein
MEDTDAGQEFSDCLEVLSERIQESEEKHVMSVTETDESYIIEFEKDHESEDSEEEEVEDDEKSSEFLDIKSEIKAYNESDEEYGTFEGYGSIFNNTDLGNDVVIPGAFSRSLKKTGPKGVKLLYQHKTEMPIGVFEEIEEDSKGLRVRGRLAMKTQGGQEAYELMKMGALDGLSIGFRVSPKGQSYDAKTKRRMIKEVELMEISLVTFPMNPRAKVRSVKADSISIREWENGLRDVFHLSRSEAKITAKAVHDTLNQRDAGQGVDLAKAVKSLTETLKTSQ